MPSTTSTQSSREAELETAERASRPDKEPSETLSAASPEAREGLTSVLAAIGHEPADLSLFIQACTHSSYCAEHPPTPSNERLEYLGDAVVGLVVAADSYERYPDVPEGELAKIRAHVVSARVLADVADRLGLGDALLLGRGEESSNGRSKASLLANGFEALIGALYLDDGFERSAQVVRKSLSPLIDAAAEKLDYIDPKGRLQELAAQQGKMAPRYIVTGSGPDHARRYEATAYFDGEARGTGVGNSKKDAEMAAARAAVEELSRA